MTTPLQTLITTYNQSCQQREKPVFAKSGDELHVVATKNRKRKRDAELEGLKHFLDIFASSLVPSQKSEDEELLTNLFGRVLRLKLEASHLTRRIQNLLTPGAQITEREISPSDPRRIPAEKLPYSQKLLPYADVLVEVGEKKDLVPCHRLKLGYWADFFHILFQGRIGKPGREVVHLPNVSTEGFLLFLDHCYNEKLPEDPQTLMELAILADFLRDSHLLADATDTLKPKLEKLAPEEALGLLNKVGDCGVPDQIKTLFIPALVALDPRELTESQMEIIVDSEVLPYDETTLFKDKLLPWEEAHLKPGEPAGSLIFRKSNGGQSLADRVRYEWMGRRSFMQLVGDSPFMPPEKKWELLSQILTTERNAECVGKKRPNRSSTCAWVDSLTQEGDATCATIKGHFQVPDTFMLPNTGNQYRCYSIGLFGESWKVSLERPYHYDQPGTVKLGLAVQLPMEVQSIKRHVTVEILPDNKENGEGYVVWACEKEFTPNTKNYLFQTYLKHFEKGVTNGRVPFKIEMRTIPEKEPAAERD